jgi:hypothetical protein
LHTHAKITATLSHAGATLKIGKGSSLTAVASGTASGAIPLSVGANVITIEVTAEDGTTKRTSTVTITRQQAQPTDATLSGLTATSGTSASGTFTSLNIGTFSAATTSYAATVANSVTHVKLTPTAAHSSATVTVAGTAVTSGTASGAIALSVGSNAIAVRVTAQDGTTTKDYTVTVTRQQSSNANLSGLAATTSTSSSGTFTSLTLSPSTFSAATTSYAATVANARTHAQVTPTVAHASATVTVAGTTVTSGTASGAIALSVGSNAITVRVTAQDGTTTRDYTVTITRQAANVPPAVWLSASPNPVTEGSPVTVTARLSAALSSAVTIPLTVSTASPNTAESGDVGTLTSIVIASGQTSGTGTITANQDSDEDDETFTVSLGSLPSSVTAGTPNSVRITISDDDGGTAPTPPAVSLSASPNPVGEGSPVTVTARLSSALSSAVTIPLTLSSGTAESGDYGSLSSITIGSGSTTGTGTITTNQDNDEDDETFTVSLGSLPSSVTAGNRSAVTVRIRDDDRDTAPTPRAVSLSASPNPVTEGSSVTVTARLSSALSSSVTIPLTLTDGTAESGDYGSLSSITVSAGSTTGTGTITTNHDDDTDDETFTVALGILPSSVRAGSPGAVEVAILDYGPPNHAPEVTAWCDPCRVGPGGEVRLTAEASDPDGDPLTYAWSAPRGGFEGRTDAAAARWRAPADTGRFTIRVRVSDGLGETASATVRVEVANAPPAFGRRSYTFRLRENEDGRDVPVAVGAAVAEDPDGDEVTYALASGDADLFTVGAGDGAVAYVGPGEDYETEPNRYELTVRARDPHGAEALAPVVVEVVNVNEAPVAAADEAATLEDEPVVIDVLSNDTDVDGDALRVESVTAPSHGTARVAAGGGVVYAPEADWHGTDRFSYTVSDGNGGTATAEVVVVVAAVNDAPEAVGAMPDQSLDEGGGSVALDLAPYFEDRDGDPLTYSASSSDPGVAAVAVAGSMLTVTPVGYGEATVEVTARDPGGLDARQAFGVGASDRMARLALDETLAAMGRAHIASARMTLGRRVVPGGGGRRGSMLTVMGRRVPLGRDAAREAAGRLLEGWAVSRLWRGGGLAEAGRAFEGRMAEWAAAGGGGPDGPADASELAAALGVGGPLGGLRSLGGSGGGTEWDFAFGERREGSARPGGAWRFWGQGDIQTFAGEPSAERGYEGDLRTGWAGLDLALDARWLVGLAIARSGGGGDWRAGSAAGRLETSLTAVQPYLRWSDGATSVWAMGGGGWGSAENARATGRLGASSLGLRLGLFEARRRFTDWLGLRADAAWARLATGAGDETVDGRSATVNQQRLGIELRPSSPLGGGAVEPFAEAAARRDGGAGQTGSGLEVSGGIRAAGGPVRIDARGRLLVLHSARGYEERGLGVTIAVGSPAAEEGLSLSVSPRWGGSAGAAGALWNDRHGALRPDAPAAAEPWALDARGRWAVRLPDGRLLAWSGGLVRSARGYAFTLGGGFGVPDADAAPAGGRGR